MYADLDMESVQSVESLRHHQAVISREPALFAVSMGRDTNVQVSLENCPYQKISIMAKVVSFADTYLTKNCFMPFRNIFFFTLDTF